MEENWRALHLAIITNLSVNQAVAVLDGEMTEAIAKKLKEKPKHLKKQHVTRKKVNISEETIKEVIELRKLNKWSDLAYKYNINISTLKSIVKKYKTTKELGKATSVVCLKNNSIAL